MEVDFATFSEKCLATVFYAKTAIILQSFGAVTAKSNYQQQGRLAYFTDLDPAP